MPQPIRRSAVDLDLSPRIQSYQTVDASPAAAAETVVATLTITGFGDLSVVTGVHLTGWAAFTVGTAGVSALLRIKRASTAGATIATSGAITETAANLDEAGCQGLDTAPTAGIYVLTLTMASASAASAVSACKITSIVV